MPWRQADFRGKKVWAEVDASGAPKVSGGRVPIRYSKRGGVKIYGAGASRVTVDDTAAIEELPEGISADEAAKKGAGKARKGSGFGSAGTRTAQQKAMAADAARKMLAELGDDVIRAFSDGACRGNPGPAGAGAVVQLPDGRVGEAWRSLGRATNNVGELTAIGMVLELLDEAEVPASAPVVVFTDSSYSHGVLVRGWKAKANTALIVGLRDRLKGRPGVTLQWIAGHVGIDGNERADTLANRGVDGQSGTAWS